MFARFLRRVRRDDDGIAYSLYGAIVAQARSPVFYTRLSVPDTVDGRLEMIVLHTVLLFHRLGRDGRAGQEIGQAVFDVFVADMDRSLREMGAGDMAVPRKMKAIAESFYGRLAAYGAAVESGDRAELERAIERNLPGAAIDPAALRGLATHAVATMTDLAGQPLAAIARGEIRFLPPMPEMAEAAL